MRQDFSNVSAEQLAELFPVLLAEHDPAWREYYLQEAHFLRAVFGDNIIRISHIGSSAVPGLYPNPPLIFCWK